MNGVMLLNMAPLVCNKEGLKELCEYGGTRIVVCESTEDRLINFRESGADLVLWQKFEAPCGESLEKRLRTSLPTLSDTNLERFKALLENQLLIQENAVLCEYEHYYSLAQRTWINSYSFQEIYIRIMWVRAFACSLVNFFEIDRLITNTIPHEFSDYIIFREMLKKRVSINLLYPSPIQNKFFVIRPGVGPIEIKNRSENEKLDRSSRLDKDVEDYVDRLDLSAKVENGSIMPYCKKMESDLQSLISKRRYSGRKALLKIEEGIKYLEVTTDTLRMYHSISKRIKDIGEGGRKNHYLPLHYEPESTFMPACGLKFTSQLDVARYVLKCIGDEDRLYIKEHPVQYALDNVTDGWHYVKYPRAYRSKEFYEILNMDKRVTLLDINTSNKIIYKLIVPKVWTVTGTSALEAFMLGLEFEVLSELSPWQMLKNIDRSLVNGKERDIVAGKLNSYLVEWVTDHNKSLVSLVNIMLDSEVRGC